jgi:hypothetical protein
MFYMPKKAINNILLPNTCQILIMAVLSKSTRNTGESGKNIVGFGDRRPEYSQERDTTVPCS